MDIAQVQPEDRQTPVSDTRLNQRLLFLTTGAENMFPAAGKIMLFLRHSKRLNSRFLHPSNIAYKRNIQAAKRKQTSGKTKTNIEKLIVRS